MGTIGSTMKCLAPTKTTGQRCSKDAVSSTAFCGTHKNNVNECYQGISVDDAIEKRSVHETARNDALGFLYEDEPWFTEPKAEESEAEESEAEAPEAEAELASELTTPFSPQKKRKLDTDISGLMKDVVQTRKRLKTSTSEKIDEMLQEITQKMISLREAIDGHVYVRDTVQLENELDHLERVLQKCSHAHQALQDEMSKPSEAQTAFVAEKKRFVNMVVEKYDLTDLLESLGISD